MLASQVIFNEGVHTNGVAGPLEKYNIDKTMIDLCTQLLLINRPRLTLFCLMTLYSDTSVQRAGLIKASTICVYEHSCVKKIRINNLLTLSLWIVGEQ
jgi:hypothetical protein